MKPLSLTIFARLALVLALAAPGFCAAPQAKAGDNAGLENILKKMDAVAASFRSAQATFEWDTYQKVIDEMADVETGAIYYRHSGNQIEMMAEVKMSGSSLSTLKPEPKFVLLKDGKIRMYQPKPDQVTEFDMGKNRAD